MIYSHSRLDRQPTLMIYIWAGLKIATFIVGVAKSASCLSNKNAPEGGIGMDVQTMRLIYHYLLDSATATPVTMQPSMPLFANTMRIQLGEHAWRSSWSLSENFMCICLDFHTIPFLPKIRCLRRYLINGTDGKIFQSVVTNFSFIVTNQFRLSNTFLRRLSGIKHLCQKLLSNNHCKEYSHHDTCLQQLAATAARQRSTRRHEVDWRTQSIKRHFQWAA